MSTPRLNSIPTARRGRPQLIRTRAEQLIGSSGVAALNAADLWIVSGAVIRELALIVGEPALPEPVDPKGTPDPAAIDLALED